MKRTPPLRSLAAAAVGALAVSGLASPPSATGAATGVLLLSQQDRVASVRYDGSDAAIQLTAQQLDPATTVTFEFNRNPAAGIGSAGWSAVPGSPSMTGIFAHQTWEPPSGLVGRRVAVRAVATGASTSYSLRNDVLLAGQDDLEHSVSLGEGYFPFGPPPPSTDLVNTGFFVQPYADSGRTATTLAVPGTTTARGGSVELTWWRESDRTFRGRVDAAVSASTLKAPGGPPFGFSSTPGGSFAGVLNIAGATPTPGDVLAVRAERVSDDVRPTTLYEQFVNLVSAASDSSAVRPGETARVRIQVFDSSSRPIAGAEVRRMSDGGLVGYTDGTGLVVARQAGGTAETYYANTGDSDGFTSGDDVQSSEVAVGTYTPVPTSVQAVSQDGDRWDRDEYRRGDLMVQVLDQQFRPYGEGTDVGFRVYPNGGTPPASYRVGTADARGRVVVPFNAARPADQYVLEARFDGPGSDPATSTVFTIGDARLQLAPASNPVEPIGGQVDYVGRLVMGGQPLTGRRLSLRFLRGVEVVPGLRPDAAILQGRRRVLARTVETDENGEFEVTVDDLGGRPRASEVGGRLVIATVTQPPSADVVDGDPRVRRASAPRFGDGRRGSVRVVLGGADNGRASDVLRVTAPTSVAGETVRIFRTAPGGRTLVAVGRLGRAGDLPRVVVGDDNGADLSAYVVTIVPSRRVVGSSSAPHRVR